MFVTHKQFQETVNKNEWYQPSNNSELQTALGYVLKML
jgi:spore coat protein CotF